MFVTLLVVDGNNVFQCSRYNIYPTIFQINTIDTYSLALLRTDVVFDDEQSDDEFTITKSSFETKICRKFRFLFVFY